MTAPVHLVPDLTRTSTRSSAASRATPSGWRAISWRTACAVQVLTKRIGPELPDDDGIDGIAIRRIGPFGERSSSGKWLMTPADRSLARPPRRRLRRRLLRRLSRDRRRRAAGAARHRTPGRVSGANHRRAVGRQRRSAARAAPASARRGLDRRAPSSGRSARSTAAPTPSPASRATSSAKRSPAVFLANVCTICRTPIDMTRFRPPAPGERDRLRQELGLPAERVICLFVGRLSREKGVMDLLEAWRLRPAVPARCSSSPGPT